MEAAAPKIFRGLPVDNSLSDTQNRAAWTATLADRAKLYLQLEMRAIFWRS